MKFLLAALLIVAAVTLLGVHGTQLGAQMRNAAKFLDNR